VLTILREGWDCSRMKWAFGEAPEEENKPKKRSEDRPLQSEERGKLEKRQTREKGRRTRGLALRYRWWVGNLGELVEWRKGELDAGV
jgi:hypothetical protein